MKFYKYGIELCDGSLKQYGGHTHWLSKLLNISYLAIQFRLGFGYETFYYDGQHHCLELGIISLHWMD